VAEAKVEDLGFLLAAMPPEERARRYRQMAADAFRLAASTNDMALKAGHLSLASGWQVLAIEIEHTHGLAVPADRKATKQDRTIPRGDA
jgi:hypothetical protein